MEEAYRQIGETIRFTLAGNQRTARLSILMIVALITWYYIF